MICSSLRSPISESRGLKLTEVATNASSDFDRLRRDCMGETLPRFPLVLHDNLDKCAFYAAFWKATNSVLVAANRCAFSENTRAVVGPAG
jgi:hypothetical protein